MLKKLLSKFLIVPVLGVAMVANTHTVRAETDYETLFEALEWGIDGFEELYKEVNKIPQNLRGKRFYGVMIMNHKDVDGLKKIENKILTKTFEKSTGGPDLLVESLKETESKGDNYDTTPVAMKIEMRGGWLETIFGKTLKTFVPKSWNIVRKGPHYRISLKHGEKVKNYYGAIAVHELGEYYLVTLMKPLPTYQEETAVVKDKKDKKSIESTATDIVTDFLGIKKKSESEKSKSEDNSNFFAAFLGKKDELDSGTFNSGDPEQPVKIKGKTYFPVTVFNAANLGGLKSAKPFIFDLTDTPKAYGDQFKIWLTKYFKF